MIKIGFLFVGVNVCNAGFEETYDLLQDAGSETYFMQNFIGSKVQEVNMLIDTQANGTAVAWDPSTSLRSRVHNDQSDTVEFLGGKVDGLITEDYFCLD